MAVRDEGRGRRWGAALVVLGALGTALLGRLSGCADTGLTPVASRGAARELELPVVAGAEVPGGVWRLSAHRGDVALVNLWATWCGPCRGEEPELVRMAREDRGLAVVGLSMDEGADREEKVRAFVREFGVGYPVAMGGTNLALTGGVEGIPTTMLFDHEGRLAKVYVGEAARGSLERDVRMLEREQ